LWNHAKTDGPRTNNHLEGFHNKLNRRIKKAHPSIYDLIDTFKVFDTNTIIGYNGRLNGDPAPSITDNLQAKNELIKINTARVIDGQITIRQFLETSRLLINVTNTLFVETITYLYIVLLNLSLT
jgi:hypothetical protein